MAGEEDEFIQFLRMFCEDAEVLRLLDLCVGRVLRKIAASRRGWRDAAMAVDLKHVVDWLAVSVLHGEEWLSNVDEQGRPRKLMKFGDLDGVLKEANKAMVRRAMQTPAVKIKDGDEVLDAMSDEGWYFVRLLTEAALDNESAAMQHCVGHGTYDRAVASGKTWIVSLRDPHNNPHVTIEIDAAARSVEQVRGKQNEKPKPEYARRVRRYVTAKQFRSIYRPMDIGIVFDDRGTAHDVDALPEWLSVKGVLDLSRTELSELPRYLEVRGDLNIEGSSIRALPEGLRVSGRLLAGGSALASLRRDHGVGSSIDVSETAVRELPEGLEVDGTLDVSGTPMAALPEGLVVTGDLVAVGTPIGTFPASVVVGRNIDVSNAPAIRFESDALYVGGCLIANGCPDVRLPGRLSVERSLFVEGTVISDGGDHVEVGGNLWCAGSSFEPGFGSFRVAERVIRERKSGKHDLGMALYPQERQGGRPAL
jgi:hypothetical protein